MERVNINFYEVLPRGKKNAISTKELVSMLGLTSKRELQHEIQKARNEGEIILSDTSSKGGYYLPNSNEEIEEFINTMKSKAISTLRSIKSAREYLKQDAKQLTFDDVEMWVNNM